MATICQPKRGETTKLTYTNLKTLSATSSLWRRDQDGEILLGSVPFIRLPEQPMIYTYSVQMRRQTVVVT